MHSQLALSSVPYKNRWRSWHPMEKAVPAGGLLILAITSPSVTVSCAVAGVASLAALGPARVGVANWMKWLSGPALLAGGSAILTASSDPQLAASVFLRAVACAASVALLALTTPMLAILDLFRRCGLPAPVVDLLWLVIRTVTLTIESVTTARQALLWRVRPANWREEIEAFAGVASACYARSVRALAARERSAEWRLGGAAPTLLPFPRPVSTLRLGLAGAAFVPLLLLWLTERSR